MDLLPSGRSLAHWDNTCFGVVCDACGRRDTHRIADLKRGMPASTELRHMLAILTAMCRRENLDCQAVLVSADDGCSEEG